MTIRVPYRGVIEITGDHDVGKTIAALQVSNNMKDVVFVDDDVKGEGTVRQMAEQSMEFDLYIDLAKERMKLGDTPTADELLKHIVLPTIERIKAKKRKVIIWDTWRIVYQSARGHVERNQSKYSNVVNFRGNIQIIQGLISKVARMIEQKQVNELKSICDLLIVTHHVKDNYVGGVAVGKIPESSNTFNEICNMRMWLRRNPISKVPVILFLKRPSLPKQTKDGLVFQNIVPLKITPTEKHKSIWEAISEYEEKPIESRKPTVGETPTAEELAAISGTLSQEQQDYVKRIMAYNEKLEKDLQEAVVEASATSAKIWEESEEIKLDEVKAPTTALQMIGLASSMGLSLANVMEITGVPFAEMQANWKSEYWDKIVQYKENGNDNKDNRKGKSRK